MKKLPAGRAQGSKSLRAMCTPHALGRLLTNCNLLQATGLRSDCPHPSLANLPTSRSLRGLLTTLSLPTSCLANPLSSA